MTYQPPIRLLAGPSPRAGTETFAEHVERLRGLPPKRDRRELIPILEASGLLGRGGAGFPVGSKWRSVAERAGGRAVVVVNGAEGEPGSIKDRALMTLRPHLVIDGALLAADAVGAEEIVVYIGEEHSNARAAMGRAVEERAREIARPIRVVAAPMGYVSGEASAALHYINRGDARPTNTPPRTFESGVRGRPTLVQNVESLAYAALVGRFGEAWYRSVGQADTPGTGLITVGGAAPKPGVCEIELGLTVGDVADLTGATESGTRAVLLGGYFGTWASAAEAWTLPLDPTIMRARGLAFGCGIISFLPPATCGVSATAQITAYMATESAGQCGPCVFGLRAIADTTTRLATGEAAAGDVANVERWTGQIPGRGACRHPDGAVQLMTSALNVFADEFAHHERTGRCSVTDSEVQVA
ncbi:MAG: proton-conducting membrane transporter [Chloroflexota bacterium]|nr:proton-conducting membrane transporter [Chloroflexota bacterium]